jgi:hypothetical protein
MYKIQEKPDPDIIVGDNPAPTHDPIVTLKDEYGGVAHIINDDHCYVLVLGSVDSSHFKSVKHWFPEAVEAMRMLPTPE